jgi:predicted aspartyl protease
MHALLPLLVAATGALSVMPATPDRFITAEFTRTSLVLVPVFVNAQGPYQFVIDTGATTTTLDEHLATRLGLRGTHAIEIVTSSGTFSAPLGTLHELSIGSARVSALRVSWMPLRELKRDDRRIAGIIGQDILGRHTLTIDYAHRRIELTTNPCTSDDVSVPVAWSHGRPMIRTTVRGDASSAQPARLVLDSAANAMILFSKSFSAGEPTSVSTHQATMPAEFIPRVRLVIEGLRREGPAVLIAPTAPRDETGLLPTAWFSRVCIDGPRSRATLSPDTTRAGR